jgi:hypothetical protein
MVDCRATSTSILALWNGVDAYIIEADKRYCTAECPCNITPKTPSTFDQVLYPTSKNWVNDPLLGVTNFTSCSDSVKLAAYNAAIKVDPTLDSDNSFNAAGFAKSFAYIEKTWNCTGWCSKTYPVITGTGVTAVTTTVPIFRFLYNDINL